MRDEWRTWRTSQLPYLEREINYWAGSAGYQRCTAGVQAAREHAERFGMTRVAVLPGWTARYDGVLAEIVAGIDPAGLVADAGGAEIVVMPSDASLERFLAWSDSHVRWE